MADYNSDRTGANIDLTLDKVDALDAKVQPTATGVDVTGTIYPSSGVYLGGTGDANKLEDYEEGSYTATLTPSTSGTISMSPTNSVLSYTKIGRDVHVQGRLIIDSISSPAGYIKLNLPFAVPNITSTSDLAMVQPVNYGSVSIGSSDIAGFTQVLTNEARLYNLSTNGLVSNSAQQVQENTTFLFSFTYIATD